jgi:glucose-1-phosphate thymidylyltransferase
MIGIVLAGGIGSRLRPLTFGISKQIIPIYDKPMIYYSMSTLMSAGMREIILISNPLDLPTYKVLLGDGSRFGITIIYLEQQEPNGIGETFLISERLIKNRKCGLILGDNIFHGVGLGTRLSEHKNVEGAHIFAYQVSNPESYGVLELDPLGNPLSIEEKPEFPKSNFAIPGLYFYDETVIEIAKHIKPSPRGELEISDINRIYLDKLLLNVSILPRGTAWLDTGTIEDLYDASSYVRTIEKRQGLKIGCLEEIAFNNGWISREDVIKSALLHKNSEYSKYLYFIASK